MNIAYSWLKEYINIDLAPVKVGEILTGLGLEVGSIEEVETVKGGLKGLVIGEVVTCEKHPDSDHLSKTTVDVGGEGLLPIVCGAPNVAAGQKVVVATVGTTLYDGDKEFTIKKSKIRGEASEGMICAEDEIGLGTSHAGIMVLDPSAVPGTPASTYFHIENDYVIEVDLTPNRIDAGSHIGVARDLAAFLKQSQNIEYKRPSVDAFKVDNQDRVIPVEIGTPAACHRYAGVSISGVEIKESPAWLKNRLKLIGLNPINNVVDVTNYVLMETGQPLHAFDASEISGGKVIVKTLAQGTKFITLDGVVHELHSDDLMICNGNSEPMCIGGVFGGEKSGVKDTTTTVFLESAWFDSVYIRKTARRHGLNTDASFRFERGTDPDGVIYALKRAALLIQETAGGKISSDIVDIYPEPAKAFEVELNLKNVSRLIGLEIPVETIKNILTSLEVEIIAENGDQFSLKVPPYRVDVQREADVIEDILRVYGYNNVHPGRTVHSNLQFSQGVDKEKIKNMVSDLLVSNGFNEIWSNSLTKSSYYDNLETFKAENTVMIYNPLSQDLNAMRQSLLFGGLEAILRNTNFGNPDLKLFEFGNTYFFKNKESLKATAENYYEEMHLCLFVTGKKGGENWITPAGNSSFYELKSYVTAVLKKLGINIEKLKTESVKNDIIEEGLAYRRGDGKTFAEFGFVSGSLLKKAEIDNDVYYADFNWDFVLQQAANVKFNYTELPKFPAVRRDLALLVDESVTFTKLKEVAKKTEKSLLREVDVFDVYKGDKLPAGKKSYALSFILRDDEKTLNEQVIERTMNRLIGMFEKELGAKLR
ncbi:MAG TPA: phenylalanine--tRNA ligase subunit beta [Prolixibacteraceae bacterium]|nr:phenylalanine--tRNA ligase subunit beta [Prolixibacteraceae bacterium]HPS13189.1 phenylalanine--tRNA ligase subunit beta [Prolixibacteraceae bacterium]